MKQQNRARRISRRISLAATLLVTLALSGCNASVGVGMNVSVPVGNNGQMSLSTGRWL